MPRFLLYLALALVVTLPQILIADENSDGSQDDGPAISITSPDTASTFAYGTIKDHALIWDKTRKVLIARVTFTDAEQNMGTPNEDTHEFVFPGVSFDEGKGIFVAVSAKGETIPVACYKKALFFKTIATTPNAVVRVLHPRGNVTVILEALKPDDPALHTPHDTNPDGTHKLDFNSVLQ